MEETFTDDRPDAGACLDCPLAHWHQTADGGGWTCFCKSLSVYMWNEDSRCGRPISGRVSICLEREDAIAEIKQKLEESV